LLWITRQFLDGYAQHPLRFAFKDISTGDILYIYDLEFKPENYTQGTFTNRGYFQPIENYLGQYSTDEYYQKVSDLNALISSKFATIDNDTSSMETRIDTSIATLNSRILSIENRLPLYASLFGAHFINPRANSPAAADNSARIATTENVRNFVAQYPFPPKNVKNLSATPDGLFITIKWNDPVDFIYDDMTLSEWAGTKIVYRSDRYPISETDGAIAVDNTWRDYYSTYGFEITTAAPGLTYYFQAFPYSSKGAFNRNVANRASIRISGVFVGTPLSLGRSSLAAATDGNGNVLFGGGYTGGNLSAYRVDKFDSSGNLTMLNLSIARQLLAASTDANGSVLFAGGRTSSPAAVYSTIDRFDINGNRSTLDLSIARNSLASTADGNKNVLFGGGISTAAGDAYSSRLDKFDVNGNRTILALSQPKNSLAASTDGNGNALFGGGRTLTSFEYSDVVDKFDINGNLSYLSLSVARSNLSATTDGSGSVLFGGGLNRDLGTLTTVDKFDLNGNRIVYNLSTPRDSGTATVVKDGSVLFAGGSDNSSIIDRFDNYGNRSTYQLTAGRSYLAAATNNEGNALFGGGLIVGTYENLYSDAVDIFIL